MWCLLIVIVLSLLFLSLRIWNLLDDIIWLHEGVGRFLLEATQAISISIIAGMREKGISFGLNFVNRVRFGLYFSFATFVIFSSFAFATSLVLHENIVSFMLGFLPLPIIFSVYIACVKKIYPFQAAKESVRLFFSKRGLKLLGLVYLPPALLTFPLLSYFNKTFEQEKAKLAIDIYLIVFGTFIIIVVSHIIWKWFSTSEVSRK